MNRTGVLVYTEPKLSIHGCEVYLTPLLQIARVVRRNSMLQSTRSSAHNMGTSTDLGNSSAKKRLQSSSIDYLNISL